MLSGNKTWMQFVHCDYGQKVNVEMDEILVGADAWHHLLVTTDGFSITYYIDGELLVNNSYSGSQVAKVSGRETLFPSACSAEGGIGITQGSSGLENSR